MRPLEFQPIDAAFDSSQENEASIRSPGLGDPPDSSAILSGDCDPLLLKMVDWIESRRLLMPALMLLEMHRPLRGLAHASALILEPTLRALVGGRNINPFMQVLSDPQRLNSFMALLRKRERAQSEMGRPTHGS